MPPKFKFTKEEIILAALEITRQYGIDTLTARSLANKLGSSPKPVFGLFNNMDEVKSEVISAANRRYNKYITDAMKKGDFPPYKASGMAYIRFAKEETELFKLLFMRDRTGEKVKDSREEIRPMLEIIKSTLNIDEEKAIKFHIELWLFVHGIATMLATSYLEWDLDFIDNALTDAYKGLRHRFSEE